MEVYMSDWGGGYEVWTSTLVNWESGQHRRSDTSCSCGIAGVSSVTNQAGKARFNGGFSTALKVGDTVVLTGFGVVSTYNVKADITAGGEGATFIDTDVTFAGDDSGIADRLNENFKVLAEVSIDGILKGTTASFEINSQFSFDVSGYIKPFITFDDPDFNALTFINLILDHLLNL